MKELTGIVQEKVQKLKIHRLKIDKTLKTNLNTNMAKLLEPYGHLDVGFIK